MDKTVWKSPPPPPSLCLSPNNLGFQSLRAKSLCVCVLRYWRGRGVDFQECVWSLIVSPLVAKKIQDIFSQKKNRHGKFQWILSNLENRYKIVTWGRLDRNLSIVSENQTKLLLLLHRVYKWTPNELITSRKQIICRVHVILLWLTLKYIHHCTVG